MWKLIRIDAQGKIKTPRQCDDCKTLCSSIWYIRRDHYGAAELVTKRTSSVNKDHPHRVTGFRRRKIYCETCAVLSEIANI